MATKWELRGKALAEALNGITDDKAIEGLAKGVVAEIIATYTAPTSRKTPLAAVRKAVEIAFPSTKKQTSDYQYFSKSGKGNVPRYEHQALRYLTLPKEDWDALGDTAREEYLEMKESVQMEPTNQLNKSTLSNMHISQLEFDDETRLLVTDALVNSQKTLAEFVTQACKVYAKTVNGRAKADTDLSTVPTSELLDTEINQYKTHPKKIEELTRRAIKAITTHNDKSAETDQKWFLSATAINGLTGSRVQSVNKILEDYKSMVDAHNDKHGLTAYTNRGSAKNRQIHLEIPLASLVPNGIDL
ncbi:MAG: hypothetical protein PUP93_13770 [Rhizonema sp. NSF051]|nr:hypothetical protein [Rhizonema sp. NSF051]